jgi:hypothetical protein
MNGGNVGGRPMTTRTGVTSPIIRERFRAIITHEEGSRTADGPLDSAVRFRR